MNGEPVMGALHVAEAHVWGTEAIATAKFDAVDESGQPIEPLAIARKPGPSGSWRFVGLVTVPIRPFRVVLSGRDIHGQPFRRVYRRLFTPTDRAPSRAALWADLSPEEASFMRRMLDEAGPRLITEVQSDLAPTQDGVIVIPRMQVSNVTYAPLLSAHGRPIGLRIAYDALFSEWGQYNPDVQVEAEYKPRSWQRLTRMEVLDSRITPMPREAFQPYDAIRFGELRMSPLESGAHYTYEAGTIYHFTADLVPNYAVHNLDKSKKCIYYQQFPYSAESKAAFAQILATVAATPYAVAIGRGAFKGRIQNFYGEGIFHQSFVEEGAPDCGPQPTRRF